jgi:hypothetical protein
MKNFHLPDSYESRLNNLFFNDTELTDEYQLEVYIYAEHILSKHGLKSVLDIGTGSGYKLLKHFNEIQTLGIDLPTTVEFLRKKYPNKNWSDEFKPVLGYDLIIASDIIEHIPNPDILLNLIKESNPKMVILSTPERNLVYKNTQLGPPLNPCHCREWTKEEFYNYVSSFGFKIIKHIISNKNQGTQLMLCTINTNLK